MTKNPFTEYLGRRLNNQSFKDFIRHWDNIERLVIRINRREGNFHQDSIAWKQNRSWLIKHYSRWKSKLDPFWKGTKTGGKPTLRDPFLTLLNIDDAYQLVDNREAIQTLPAAREAINKYLKEKYPMDNN